MCKSETTIEVPGGSRQVNDTPFQPLAIPTIDGHVHLTHHDGIEDILQVSRAAGIGRTCIVCVPGTPERSLNCNACAFLAKGLYPNEVYAFGRSRGHTYTFNLNNLRVASSR